jgi:hypothetical protein
MMHLVENHFAMDKSIPVRPSREMRLLHGFDSGIQSACSWLVFFSMDLLRGK